MSTATASLQRGEEASLPSRNPVLPRSSKICFSTEWRGKISSDNLWTATTASLSNVQYKMNEMEGQMHGLGWDGGRSVYLMPGVCTVLPCKLQIAELWHAARRGIRWRTQSIVKKAKESNLITGLDRHWRFQEGEARRFQDNRHMKVVRLSALRTGLLYPPGNIPGTHFC